MSEIKFKDFRKIVFFTGAGMSAESGIPTYRGKGGMWEKYNYEDYACQSAFDRDPEHVWEFHEARRQAVADCEPNRGHQIIAELVQGNEHVSVVTQNIDGLHQRAGAKQVFELHGSLWRVRVDALGLIEENFDVPMKTYQHSSGAYWRPDIVWFGDHLRSDVIQGALEQIKGCDLLVSIGTSGVVFPAAQFPVEAKLKGATLVEINPEETAMSEIYDVCLRGSASDMLASML